MRLCGSGSVRIANMKRSSDNNAFERTVVHRGASAGASTLLQAMQRLIGKNGRRAL